MSAKRNKPRPGKTMADRLATFCSYLTRSVELCDALSAVYAPDAALDWASRTLMQIANLRMSLADRLANPQVNRCTRRNSNDNY
jgi:hypothetical protein